MVCLVPVRPPPLFVAVSGLQISTSASPVPVSLSVPIASAVVVEFAVKLLLFVVVVEFPGVPGLSDIINGELLL